MQTVIPQYLAHVRRGGEGASVVHELEDHLAGLGNGRMCDVKVQLQLHFLPPSSPGRRIRGEARRVRQVVRVSPMTRRSEDMSTPTLAHVWRNDDGSVVRGR